MKILTRAMTTEDAEQVAEIEKLSFSMPWSKEAFLESLSYEHALFLVAYDAENENKAAGYIGMYKVFDEGEITNIAVRPEYRGMGVGSTLMNEVKKLALAKDIENIILEVRESNAAAISLYEKTGFKRAGIRKNFYERPVENAIVMYMQLLPL